MPFQTGGAAGVTTLSDLQIDVDKDWKAHGIYNLGDLTPKVDGAYNLASSAYQFNAVYSRNVTVGDIRMGNEWKITEHPEYGVALESPEGVIHRIELEEENEGGD